MSTKRKRKPKPLPRLAFTVAEWAQMTGLGRATVYRQMQAGKLRFVQFGGARRIPADEQRRLGLLTA
jgi:excisionase family DNA binding protein